MGFVCFPQLLFETSSKRDQHVNPQRRESTDAEISAMLQPAVRYRGKNPLGFGAEPMNCSHAGSLKGDRGISTHTHPP